MAIRITTAHTNIKVFEVIRVLDGFSCNLEIGRWNMAVLLCESPGKAIASGAPLSEQPPNSPSRIFKSVPCMPVPPTKVTAVRIARSFEFLLPVFNSCDNFGLDHRQARK